MGITGTSTSGELTGRRRPDCSRRNNTALAIASAVVSTDVSSGRVTVAVAEQNDAFHAQACRWSVGLDVGVPLQHDHREAVTRLVSLVPLQQKCSSR